MAIDREILVIDDDAEALSQFDTMVESSGYRLRAADSVGRARQHIRERRPAAIVLARDLPDDSALRFLKELRRDARSRDAAVIYIAREGETEKLVEMLDAGADDFLVRPYSARELLARIRAVLRARAPHLCDEPARIASLCLDPCARRLTSAGQRVPSTDLEFRLLFFLVTHPGRVYTRSRLLDEVWGEDLMVEERVVDCYVRRLRMLLEPTGNSALLRTLRGVGYMCRQEATVSKPPRKPARLAERRPS